MSSSKKQSEKSWTDLIRFKKQSLVGKIILISIVLLLGSILIFVSLISFMGKWNELGKYSLWILFGWLFFIILTYISVKLISLIMHKDKMEIQELQKTRSMESSENNS